MRKRARRERSDTKVRHCRALRKNSDGLYDSKTNGKWEWGMGNGELGTGNGESLKAGIFKMVNLKNRESLKAGIFCKRFHNRG